MKGNLNIYNQIFKEMDYYFKYYNLKSVIYIAYDRESYKGKNSDLRITFDSNLRSRRNDLVFKKVRKWIITLMKIIILWKLSLCYLCLCG